MSNWNRMVAICVVILASAGPAAAQYDNFYGQVPIITAARNGDAGTVQRELDAGTSANTADADGATVLMIASTNGKCRIAELVLKYKARTDVKDKEGNTALMLASDRGYVD